ncbi:MAG: hypothetical protein Kapaf2KO_17910 [Candidatus Kapaibacteriales bacterium]
MINIFQDSLSGEVLGATDKEISEHKIGENIDLKSYLDIGNSEEVEIISITASKSNISNILIKVKPHSYKGINPENRVFDGSPEKGFLYKLEDIVEDRKSNPSEASYTSSLLMKGNNEISEDLAKTLMKAVLEAKDGKTQTLTSTSADLFYLLQVFLTYNSLDIKSLEAKLLSRHRKLHS